MTEQHDLVARLRGMFVRFATETEDEAAIRRKATALEAAARIEALEAALQYVDDCFNAAIIEGWIDAKEEGDIERIRDLWQRRISYAWSNTINVLQDGKGEESERRVWTSPDRR